MNPIFISVFIRNFRLNSGTDKSIFLLSKMIEYIKPKVNFNWFIANPKFNDDTINRLIS